MNMNIKITQPASEEGRKSSAPASIILLPDGILDFSDDLSNDGDDFLDEDDLKLKRPTETNADGSDNKADKTAADSETARAKLRIKTGGKFKQKCEIHMNVSILIEPFEISAVRKLAGERPIGSMLGEDGESDFDSSLEYIAGAADSDDSEINLENDPAANVEALYNFSENAPARIKSAKPKTNQSDEDFWGTISVDFSGTFSVLIFTVWVTFQIEFDVHFLSRLKIPIITRK